MSITLGKNALHLCIDMQRMFDEETEWHTPDLRAVLPNVERLTRAMPERTLFARFVTPARPEDALGSWQAYYRRWQSLTGKPEFVELVSELRLLDGPDRIIDKPAYSIFAGEGAESRLRGMGAGTLVFSGVETDVCVLSSLLGAVDRGFPCVIVSDATASGSMAAHRAVLETLLPRLPDQVRIASTDEVLAERESA